MSHYLSGQHTLISGGIAPRPSVLQAEFAKACGNGNTTAIINLDILMSNDNLAEAHTQINSAFASLNNNVELFVVDARACGSYGNDPIWEVPISQVLPSTIGSEIKGARRKRFTQPFSIAIIGARDHFDSGLDQVIHKLQRDILLLHQEASVNFLDIDSSVGEASIVAAIGILHSTKASGRVISINAVTNLRASTTAAGPDSVTAGQNTQLCRPISLRSNKPKVKVALSFDFDALSAFLGTGEHPDNNMSDYSTGIFSGQIGARRMLRMLQKYQLADKVTWFIPGHTMETFQSTVKEVVNSGAEIGLHGYAHEGAYQMTPAQEREVLIKCMEVSQRLTGKKVQGYRAPMYQLRETTVALLKELGFLYDSSLSHHDSQPYFTPESPPVQRIDFSQPASSWMKPTPLASMNTPVGHPLVEIPTNWHNEDMMAMQYFPHLHNSQGYVDARVVEQRWKDIFLWLWENAHHEQEDGSFVFPLLMHPDTSGMAHVIGMADRFVGWLRSWGDSVEFHTFFSIAQAWLNEQGK
ncbi:Polysaccharide deacetylase [Aspergillus sclerotialis]|uniref:Polysaccharide deacetylase n=1 Tax=Aspergillus sclerotialis TaxID=2070753 RepID=A0A3A2ZPW0_9EURO|nr:Polysaccharide deacetylase [Aspergillus sclerotialis]